jgi:PAS domain S-box-containing protein
MGLYNETELELFVRACAQHSRVSTSEEYLTEQEMLRSPLEEKFLFGSSQSQDSFFSEKELCFRLMVEAVQERSVFMFDPEGKIRSWNSGAEFMQGYSAEEILGRNVSCLYSDEEIPRERFKLKLAAAIKVGSFEENRWKMRKDGSTFLANITIIPARNADGHVIGFAEITRASHQIHFIDAANSRPRSCRKPFVPRT